jgi:DNA mismatch endonuclease, patch repair protein
MTDRVTKAVRSRNMAQIRSTDTMPERRVRSIVHRLGYRFRLHYTGLPGKPDIVLPRLRKIIFIHGCFWHSHGCCRARRLPQSNQSYWLPKLNKTRKRDQVNKRALRAANWAVLTVWECELQQIVSLTSKLNHFLTN